MSPSEAHLIFLQNATAILMKAYLFNIISLYNRIHKRKLQNEGPGFYVTG